MSRRRFGRDLPQPLEVLPEVTSQHQGWRDGDAFAVEIVDYH